MIKIMFGVAFGIVLAGLAIMTINWMFVGVIIEKFLPIQQEKELRAYQAEMKLEQLKREQQQALQQQAIQAQGEENAIKYAQKRAEENARDLQQEQSFKAEYKKPAECYNMQNHETRVRCANHYIEAKSDFAKKFVTTEQNQISDNKLIVSIKPKLNITIKNNSYNVANCGVMRDNKYVNFLTLNGKRERNYKEIEKVEHIGCHIKIHNKNATTYITWFNATLSGVYTLLYEKVECKTCTGIDHTWATIVVTPNGERIYQPA